MEKLSQGLLRGVISWSGSRVGLRTALKLGSRAPLKLRVVWDDS